LGRQLRARSGGDRFVRRSRDRRSAPPAAAGRRAPADVGRADRFFLSGGLDSSLSTAIAAEAASGPIKTFTLTYGQDSTTPGKEEDRRWARWVAERYHTDHHEEQVTFAGFPESIREILRSFDEPFAGVVSSYFCRS
jgi:asparagine synthase (glutamine-hydrolysing)